MADPMHREQRLDRLFQEYREACPELEGGANFLPRMWERIESRRSPLLEWVTMSRRALVGALALCMVLGFVLGTAFSSSTFYQMTYLEALEDNNVPEELAGMQPPLLEPAGSRK